MQKYLHITWRLWKLLKPFHKDFYIQLFATILDQAIGIGITLIMAKTIDALINKDINLIYLLIILYPLVSFIRNRIGVYVDVHAFNKLETAIQQFLEEYSFKNIFKLNASQYSDDHSAIKLQVINRGESAVESIINTIVLNMLPVSAQIIFSIIALSFYSKIIAAWSFVTLVIVVIWGIKFSEMHRPLVKKNQDRWDKQKKIRSEAFQHLHLIKIFSTEIFYLKKYLKNRFELITFHRHVWVMSIIHGYRRGVFMIFSRTGTFIIVIVLFFKGSITVGAVYAIWSWINDVYNNIQNILRAIRQVPLRFVELDKYLEIIDKEPDFDEKGKYDFFDGDITFENLNFKYPKGDSNVLDNININIKQGQKVAFVGASGSGKTTITRLLLRAYDYENGNIKINKVELKEINASDLRTHIGYVEQHVDLFDDTIKNNILLGVNEKTLKVWEEENSIEEKLEEIAKLSRIDEFYHRLGEKKFETEIGERGIKLSGGERQRIGIARAIIKNPSILIFDEATSALDTVNEKYIKEAIDNVSKGRTTIIIAHRLSTVLDSDIIFVMNLGKVVASGTHNELLENSEYYRELIKHQDLK